MLNPDLGGVGGGKEGKSPLNLTAVQTATTTIIQEKVELSVQGRVFGLLGSMYSGFMPLGMAIFGPMADAIPLQWIMAASGLALILISAA